MEDIEDLIVTKGRIGSSSSARNVVSRRVNATEDAASLAVDTCGEKVSEDHLLAVGRAKIYVKTYGCSHNISDGEYMSGMLAEYGYSITDTREEADLCLVNSCTVKDPSQAAFMHLVEKAKGEGQAVVVAGCVPQADKKIKGLADVSQVGISQIDRVVEVVEESLKGNTVKLLRQKTLPKLDLPKVRRNPLVEIIPLSTGCLGSCTYCKTKHARGVLGSYALDALLDRVRSVGNEGVAEIWMTSEDTGAYGRDIGSSIAELLDKTAEILPDGVMLRVGMTNPPFILEHLEAVARALNHPKVFAFLHIPVQAGCNKVLGPQGMNREYTKEDFCTVADYLIEHVPGITIATDIICGFPTETEEDFEETLDLMERYKLAIVNISQFYPRPGTPAARMKRINTKIVKDRSRRLSAAFNKWRPYTGLVGQRVRVWFNTEVSDDGRSVGHTKAYVKVLVDWDDSLPGTSHLVDLVKSERFHVEGIIVDDTKEGFTLAERKNRTEQYQKQQEKRQREVVIHQAEGHIGQGTACNSDRKEKEAPSVATAVATTIGTVADGAEIASVETEDKIPSSFVRRVFATAWTTLLRTRVNLKYSFKFKASEGAPPSRFKQKPFVMKEAVTLEYLWGKLRGQSDEELVQRKGARDFTDLGSKLVNAWRWLTGGDHEGEEADESISASAMAAAQAGAGPNGAPESDAPLEALGLFLLVSGTALFVRGVVTYSSSRR